MSLRTQLVGVFVGALSFLGLGIPAGADVLTVDCQSGPFVEIAPAVEAAVDGDTVLVSPCSSRPYAPFAIEDKTDVHVVAALGVERPVIDGDDATTCVTIGAGSERVSVEGLQVQNCLLEGILIDGSDNSAVGNLVERVLEGIRDQGVGSRVVGNATRQCATSYFLVGQSGFVARNRSTAGAFTAIEVSGDNYKVVDNFLTGNQSGGISVQRANNRIERNRSFGNLLEGGDAEILLRSGAVETVVVGNITGDSIVDFGQNSQIAGNQ